MGQSGAIRFPATNQPAGSVLPVAVEPGIVEVEFKEGVRPQIRPSAAGAASRIESPAGEKLTGLNQILKRYQLERAESSFQVSEQEALQAQAVTQQKGATAPSLGNFVTLHFSAESDTQLIAKELSQLPEVARAIAVPKAIPPQTPLNEPLVNNSDQVIFDPDTGLENQWYIFRCRANGAWTMASGNGVVIADIDWGYRTSHQDLASRLDLSRAYNAYDGGTDVSTGSYVDHGTGVIALAGGADNDLGMAGFAFGATLWPVQADSGPGTPLGGNPWARAIDWVRTADSGGRRKVIILEVQTGAYGNYEQVLSVNAAIRTAIAHGVVVCVAAGNGDRDAGIDDYGNPIQETGSILVGATAYHDTENIRAWFSNFGKRIVVCAPGDGDHDLTCDSSSDSAYRNGFGGTSGATPKVAGTVALMLEVNPSLTHEEIRTILNTTGGEVNTEDDKPVGSFLNAEEAVRMARQQTQTDRYVTFIQSKFGNVGNFEAVLIQGERLIHYWRNNNALGYPWNKGPLFGDNVNSAPALIQGSFGTRGNFEVVVREGDKLRHYWRDNDTAGRPWNKGPLFGGVHEPLALADEAALT